LLLHKECVFKIIFRNESYRQLSNMFPCHFISDKDKTFIHCYGEDGNENVRVFLKNFLSCEHCCRFNAQLEAWLIWCGIQVTNKIQHNPIIYRIDWQIPCISQLSSVVRDTALSMLFYSEIESVGCLAFNYLFYFIYIYNFIWNM
jgi:hypothetical protein